MSVSRSESPAVSPSRQAVWMVAAGLVAAVFATYWNSLRGPFFFDDYASILQNKSIRNLSALGTVLSPPADGSGVTGRPLVNLSLAINYALGGVSVTGYHLANICMHAIAGLALFGCVRRTLLRPRWVERFGRVALPVSAVSAAVWLLHPLQTESVACVIQRTELLVGMFYLLTLYCFVRAAEAPSRIWTVLTVGCCCLGMAAKEVMVTAPVLVLLFDRTFIAGTFGAAWRQRRTLYLGLGASWLLLAFLVLGAGGTRGTAAGFGVGVAWWAYALKQCEAIILYLRLTLWPHPLVLFYGTDVVTNPAEVWAQMLTLIALVAGTIYALRRRPILGFFGAWFFVILAPSSSIVPLVSQTMAEHRMYLPLVAPLTLGVALLFAYAPRQAAGVALGLLLAFGITSARRNVDFRSELAAWADTATKAPNNARARINYGGSLRTAGKASAALEEYKAALRLEPNSAEALHNIGSLLLDAGRPADAIEPCRAAVALQPNLAQAQLSLGTALAQTGHVPEGIQHMEKAVALQPEMPEAHINLMTAYTANGEIDKAIEQGKDVIRLRPELAVARLNLANAYLQKNLPERAAAELEAALQVQPDYADAHLTLAGIHHQAGNPARAIPHYQVVLRTKPQYLDALNNLGVALFQTGNAAAAIETYRAAVRINPGFAQAHSNLALVLSQQGQTAAAITEYEDALRLNPADAQAKEALAKLRAASPPR